MLPRFTARTAALTISFTAAVLLLGQVVFAADLQIRDSGPAWDLQALSQPPETFPADEFTEQGLRALYFAGLDYHGQPTRIFAWLGIPKVEAGTKVPGIVLVHGGGGTAFAEWVRLWTSRGYAAIAMDNCGGVPLRDTPKQWKRSPQPGPAGWGGWGQINEPWADQWTYHAVADVILAHSLLQAQPEVDPHRTGITGISWGGYLTCITAGVDSRLKFAIPVYGCGFTNEHLFARDVMALGPERGDRWLRWWDPSQYLGKAKMPMLWVTGSNDFAYTLNSLQKSYRLPTGPRTLCIRLRMPHGHGGAGERPKEIQVFADSIVSGGIPLARITAQGREGSTAWTTFESQAPITSAVLNYTLDRGRWQDRKWESMPAKIEGNRVSADIPTGTSVYYINLTDDRDCAVSTEHEDLPLSAES